MRKQVVSMKRGCLIFGVIMVMLLTSLALAEDYEGWDEIRPALIDGEGSEFVVDTTYGVGFGGTTEFDKVLAAANWVAFHMVYEYDPVPPGDVWTASDQQFDEIIPGEENSGTGDCEDFAILLCALARFAVGVPADRIWVQAGLLIVKGEGPPPIVGHAYVVYKAERGGIWHIEPQWGEEPYLVTYRGSKPSVTHWYVQPPPYAGESATLRFNDQWVKGGGFWLAGRRAPRRDNSPVTTWAKIKSR